jgi:hypothetical protein
MAFILFGKRHFTTLVFDIETNTALYFDSFGETKTPSRLPGQHDVRARLPGQHDVRARLPGQHDDVRAITNEISKMYTPPRKFAWKSVGQLLQPDVTNCGLIAAVNAYCFLSGREWPQQWIVKSSLKKESAKNELATNLNHVRVNFLNVFLSVTTECPDKKKSSDDESDESDEVEIQNAATKSRASSDLPAKGSGSSGGFEDIFDEDGEDDNSVSVPIRRPHTLIERAPCKIKYTTLIIRPYNERHSLT